MRSIPKKPVLPSCECPFVAVEFPARVIVVINLAVQKNCPIPFMCKFGTISVGSVDVAVQAVLV